MKNLWSVVLVTVLAFSYADADARRLGGGKSVGQQSSNVSQREATPAPGTPAQQAATQNTAARPAATTQPATPAKRPWGAMLGGLAAGLGLAWLASSLGLGEAFGNILLFIVLAIAAVAVIGLVMRARSKSAHNPTAMAHSPFAFQGAGAAGGGASNAPLAQHYSPEKVGNDASARPWESQNSTFEAMQQHTASTQPLGRSGSMIGSALAGSQNWGVPADFDTQGFLAAAKRNFITLQSAWDRADINTLRSMMTDDMLGEIRTQLTEREAQRAAHTAHTNQTDVVMIEAQLLGIEDLGHAYMASVEFSGMIREEVSAGPAPFREVWNMTKPKNGTSGWLVAGLQALQ